MSSLRAFACLLRPSAFALLVGLAPGCGKAVMSFPGGDAGSSDSGGLGGLGDSVDSGSFGDLADSGDSVDSGVTAVAGRPSIVLDKVDMLFMIDNSASMGDKQVYLEQAIPDLITALVQPLCVDASGNPAATGARANQDGTGCPSGTSPEFPPVHDMHIGIVSSSLGPRLGDQTNKGPTYGACLTNQQTGIGGATYPSHTDDQGHLLNRASATVSGVTASCQGGSCPAFPTTASLGDAPEGFLEWFPNVAENTGKDAGAGAPPVESAQTLENDFADLVAGVQQFGCGVESQLESWYRFLIQPDPYASLGLAAPQGSNPPAAQWVGVDTTILQERRDFLRPDSAVVIVDLTDENDSEIDVRSIGGQGYFFMSTGFTPPRGTSPCLTNPADPTCVSCANVNATANDPGGNCKNGAYNSATDWGYDLNLRHVHMKAKYGLDPQYPIARYVLGLTSATVPDRSGEYPTGATSYIGIPNCVNPLFAGALPDPSGLSSDAATATTLSSADEQLLCDLPAGQRPGNAVFYLAIGGVPHELLQDPSTGNVKSTLSSADWVKILGNDPEHYDYNGIDPHMIESYAPRTAQPDGTPWPFQLAAPTNVPDPRTGTMINETAIQGGTNNSADPWSGRDWLTNVGTHLDLKVDREYACIFPLATQRDCTNPDNSLACDCSTPATGTTGNDNAQAISPVCDPNTQTLQVAAKAYPTPRELLLAKKLGSQGIVASICPTEVTDNATADDPNYGYRPVVGSLLARVKSALAFQ